MRTAEYLVNIDHQLKSTLNQIAEHFEIQLEGKERIFYDCENDQLSQKNYDLYIGKKLQILGFVEEYEPESVFLRFSGLTRSDYYYLNGLFESG
ncbi:MAG: hypothetical protein RIC35_01380 [Marinoscillum sp.]